MSETHETFYIRATVLPPRDLKTQSSQEISDVEAVLDERRWTKLYIKGSPSSADWRCVHLQNSGTTDCTNYGCYICEDDTTKSWTGDGESFEARSLSERKWSVYRVPELGASKEKENITSTEPTSEAKHVEDEGSRGS
jgi:hypothetical protein